MLLALAVPFAAGAQDELMTLDELCEAAGQWAEENLDEDILRALEVVDQEAVQQFFEDLLQWFQGDDVLETGQLSPLAIAELPALEAHVETQPYAAWLKTRLDYLQVAEELRAVTPAPKPEPGQPPKRAVNPPPALEREIWRKKLAARPAPPGAERLAKRLKPIFVAQRVPSELVWLAEVESSFNPRARSPAGAAGLYQLMPATAKSRGLLLWPVDQRLDSEKNAGAAARHLKLLHDRFKDWPLALAAYNAGEGRVQSLLNKHGARTYDGISTRLPAETQMYVPKINATLLRREGVSLERLSGH